MSPLSAPEFRQNTLELPSRWKLIEVAGRLVEISSSTASAALTITFTLVRQAQERGEPVGWVTAAASFFYPPDAARGGADLAALVVVRLADVQSIARAGEKLLRSGGFGVVVLDLGAADIPMPLQTRLTGLAHRHHTALVCLTKKESAAFSLGSLVSLRAHAEKKRAADHRFTCALRIVKDKRRGPTWNYEELYTGPAGLC
jgi:recombination protein RecA